MLDGTHYSSPSVRQVSLLIRRELTDRARDFNVIVDDVSITDLTFGKDYTAAVEAKQVRCRGQGETERSYCIGRTELGCTLLTAL